MFQSGFWTFSLIVASCWDVGSFKHVLKWNQVRSSEGQRGIWSFDMTSDQLLSMSRFSQRYPVCRRSCLTTRGWWWVIWTFFLASFRNNNHKIVLVKKKKKKFNHFMCFWFSHLWRPYVWMGPWAFTYTAYIRAGPWYVVSHNKTYGWHWGV